MEELTSILDGIRQRLIPIGILLFAGLIVSYFFLDPVLKKISTDLLPEEITLIALDPLEVILLKLKISVICGVIVALPLMIYYILKVVDERIRPIDLNMKKSSILLIASIAVLLFIVGASYSYFIMMPLFFGYMYQMALDAGVTARWSIAPFINFVVMMTAVFGVVFELPLILSILVRRDIIKLETLKKYRRHAYVGLLVLSAFITSPDVFTQIIIGVPLIIFYEISIFVAGFASVEDELDNIVLGDRAFKNGLILGIGMITASAFIALFQILPTNLQLDISFVNNSTVFIDQLNQFRPEHTAFNLPLIIPAVLGLFAGYRTRMMGAEKTISNAAIILFLLAGVFWGLVVGGMITQYPQLMVILVGLGATLSCAGILTSSKDKVNNVSVSLAISATIFLITIFIFLNQEINTKIIGLFAIGAISILSGSLTKSSFQKG